MKLFIDTADRTVISRWAKTGILDGVTTNPSHLSKQGGNMREVLKDICQMLPDGDISIEVVEKEPQAVYEQALEIAEFAENAVVKIPFAEEYLPIINRLTTQGIPLNITLVFTPLQGLMVAKLGVNYISPFMGRLEEIGVSSTTVIQDFVSMIENYEFDTEILAASIRTLSHWHEAMLAGADVATLPPALFEQAVKHPLTEKGIKIFDEDWKKLGKKSLFD
ncbi:fructose-6-phosphate aldolase [Candidatus Dependentiae bacterium]|jgi:transaldolase|nr:fructose-6-phosphate aldolase [Candidatus Dependentiae bacterium]